MHDIQRETLLCEFLYSYLLYNIQHQFSSKSTSSQNGDETATTKLYKQVLRFLGNYKESRHPPTLCWLLEIMHLLSIKFSPMDAYKGDQKLKKDYYETLNDILQAASSIVNEQQYKVTYEKNYGFLIAFPP